MTVPPGFTVELVAGEPDIVNPVAMTFDERGRIWITESLEYPRREPGPGRDRVKVLEDTDGDGKADRFTVFADGLNIPSGIAVGHGGVWVANSPDILFLQDRDGDGKADTREVVVTGFGRARHPRAAQLADLGPRRLALRLERRVQPQPRSSRRTARRTSSPARSSGSTPGPASSRSGARERATRGASPSTPRARSSSSACVIDHLWHLVETGYYIRQGGPYPPFTWPIESIVDHTHQKAAYCGIHYFDSPAYPPEYRGRLYMGNIHGNCINVDMLERNGSTYRAEARARLPRGQRRLVHARRAEDRARRLPLHPRLVRPLSLLSGRQPRPRRHRPAQGAALPRALQGHRRGERASTWRRRSDDELIESAGQPERLRSRHRPAAPDRARLARRSRPSSKRSSSTTRGRARARMHGLWALIGIGPLDPGFHVELLDRTDDPTFRAWGVRAAGNMGESSRRSATR